MTNQVLRGVVSVRKTRQAPLLDTSDSLCSNNGSLYTPPAGVFFVCWGGGVGVRVF
jgi:hypothetical protein